MVHEESEKTWQWLTENGMTAIRADEIDIASIKNAIMAGIDELSADWDPCCVEICEKTRQ